MRVIHIIPSAFNYFDAIRAEAFQLVENLDAIGVENDVFTLQYGAQSKTKQEQTEIEVQVSSGSSRTYSGQVSFGEVVGTLASYDVVHAHAPLFGGAGKIIEWKKANPGVPFLVSYYQPVGASDLFGFLVRWYTIYYLPRLFKAADIVTCDSIDELYRKFGRGVVFNPEKLIEADEETKDFFGTDLTYDPNGLELTNRERLAVKYTMLYNELTN
ncbi:MAG TPA: hypothetical protein VJA27_02235 [Patescibacteria group bacterium]|nr:hypothetical protein [Patescibacteria group bacterium]